MMFRLFANMQAKKNLFNYYRVYHRLESIVSSFSSHLAFAIRQKKYIRVKIGSILKTQTRIAWLCKSLSNICLGQYKEHTKLKLGTTVELCVQVHCLSIGSLFLAAVCDGHRSLVLLQ